MQTENNKADIKQGNKVNKKQNNKRVRDSG